MTIWKSKLEKLWEKHYQDYYPALCRFAFQYLKDDLKCEDLVQSVFTHLWQHHAGKVQEDYFVQYLYTSVRNACLNEISTGKRREHILTNVPDLSVSEGNLFTEIIQNEFYRLLMQELNELPPQMSRIFKLSYLEGKSNHEIAKELNLSVHTIKATRQSAKKKLRLSLDGFKNQDETFVG